MKVIVRFAREPDGRYRAWCPALPRCVVHGQTIAEARSLIREAIDAYVSRLEDVLPRELEREYQAERLEFVRASHAA